MGVRNFCAFFATVRIEPNKRHIYLKLKKKTKQLRLSDCQLQSGAHWSGCPGASQHMDMREQPDHRSLFFRGSWLGLIG
jgi:hypothetical protein